MTLQRELWVENETLRFALREAYASLAELRDDRNRLADELADEKARVAALLNVIENMGLPTAPPVAANQLAMEAVA